MSGDATSTIYLVRLRSYLRFGWDERHRVGFRRPPHLSRAFVRRENAERFLETAPLEHNPFAQDFALHCGYRRLSSGRSGLSFWFEFLEYTGSELNGDYEAEKRELALSEFCLSLGALGIAVPGFLTSVPSKEAVNREVPRQLADWWQTTASELSDMQKTAVWRLVAPRPYELLKTELEE